MFAAAKIRRAPGRLTAGSLILHSGQVKLKGDAMFAQGVHAVFSATYPVFKPVPPPVLLRTLAIVEITIGSLLLLPLVGARLAGMLLTGYSFTLLGMYLRTPGMHDERLLPTLAGTAFAKDAWLTGIGASLVLDGVTSKKS
ncbi:MAG: hypothetical protein ABIQ09_04725 [Jatrophihabitantaceae bacterium]